MHKKLPGSAPDPARGAYSAPPDLLAGGEEIAAPPHPRCQPAGPQASSLAFRPLILATDWCPWYQKYQLYIIPNLHLNLLLNLARSISSSSNFESALAGGVFLSYGNKFTVGAIYRQPGSSLMLANSIVVLMLCCQKWNDVVIRSLTI